MSKLLPGQKTKKPIPNNVVHWKHEVSGISALLDKMKDVNLENSPAWSVGQKQYYEERLSDLLKHKPGTKNNPIKKPRRHVSSKIKRRNVRR